ncbi:glycoside hydrolase family 9 protein [Chelativorans sp. M5D2P16]|uniref:glycoside hydrolase family 9 protein n=1 Tax=Chelativorans sp. M5D2P16 TaxID=3095678 RepID=UPI002ACA5175|nr:glycoside hydrolase family 9 protein [Chelativorans sp. M5D2P16]MDZ5696826.1 glycoside hydrolase family 9 protein [Chelativorans sp. M5D2P16]
MAGAFAGLMLAAGAQYLATPARADEHPRLGVNQLGYLPDGPKRATFLTGAERPLPWRIVDDQGNEVASGQSVPAGIDPTARANTHVLDFTDLSEPGTYRIEAGGSRSHPFSIEAGLYRDLARDAVNYFYPVRSGIAIDGAIAGAAYARPAGHVAAPADGLPNKGDRAVPCLSPEEADAAYGAPWTCAYTLDVTGGWYDAGDHGKYVVNGGISVAQLMGAYERTLYVDGASAALFADDTLAIPEGGNGVPDILDEARWELEFLLKMQVPEGEPLAGMAHHKLHDTAWTGLPMLPHEDPMPRKLHRPSTAATLNLAAAAAQGARLFKTFDPAFAGRLLAAAERAWQAARDHPSLHAPASDDTGGGAYGDADVSDEFYWAAAELFITTADARYRGHLAASPYFQGEVFRDTGFDWANVAALGRLSLATVPNTLPVEDIAAFRGSVIAAARRYVTLQDARAFGQIYAPHDGKYGWGSNHSMAQIGIIVARAYDFSRDPRFRRAALEAADYLLGRNALANSFITGYGSAYSENQHSRWFAHQLDATLPHPPKGALAGGPNVWLQDAVAAGRRAGCAPQLCYVDDIESWSTNEITINWNAALAQFAAFLAEQ